MFLSKVIYDLSTQRWQKHLCNCIGFSPFWSLKKEEQSLLYYESPLPSASFNRWSLISETSNTTWKNLGFLPHFQLSSFTEPVATVASDSCSRLREVKPEPPQGSTRCVVNIWVSIIFLLAQTTRTIPTYKVFLPMKFPHSTPFCVKSLFCLKIPEYFLVSLILNPVVSMRSGKLHPFKPNLFPF